MMIKLGNYHKTYHNILMYILILLLVINISSLINNSTWTEFGLKSIDATLLILSVLLFSLYNLNEKGYFDKQLIYLFFLFNIIFYLSYLLYQPEFNFELNIRLTLYLLAILTLIFIKWNRKTLIFLSIGLSLVILFIFRNWIHNDLPLSGFRSFFKNPNGLGILLLLSIFLISLNFYDLKRRITYIFSPILLVGVIMLYSTSSRAAFYTLLLFVFCLIILKIRPALLKAVFVFSILLNFPLPFIVSILYKHNLFSDFLFKVFNGRETIWYESISNGFLSSPFLGHGYRAMPWHFTDINLTTHNVYLQILLEVGLIGLIVFLFILIKIWNLLFQQINQPIAMFSASFFVALLFYFSFELTLFPQGYSFATLGLLQWLAITIGINFNYQENKKQVNAN